MVRHYKMLQGQKRKRRTKSNCDQNENVHEEIGPEIVENEQQEKLVEDEINEPNRKDEDFRRIEEAKTTTETKLAFPSFPTITLQGNKSGNKPSVIFVIERASLEVGKIGKKDQLLDGSKHADFLRRHGRNPADYRPDIAFSVIQSVLDSSLNRYGLLKALYVHTEEGVLIDIKPHVRIPRTYDRFAGLILQLLQNHSIKAVATGEKLLRTTPNPVTQYLPTDSLKIGFSSTEKEVDIQDYVARISIQKPLVFVVGAMPHGKLDVDYLDDFIAIDDISRPAKDCSTLICEAVYRRWKKKKTL